ncbi:PKD domain-containing protein [Haloferula rosea]|uniref:PKD domain-containing protein n=1 Tax=Haloferula rosea TaxID=490093 RepID=A0A934RCU4_9BACT|nr:PKD domain-containing protein [Haloferula rosea]MBK1826929.1 PKD domain-containing protein [Haloferula rosea]
MAADVTLDGSGSSDPDGSIVSYAWTFDNGIGAATTSNPTLSFPVGTTNGVLVVTDDQSNLSPPASFEVTVTASAPDPLEAFENTIAGQAPTLTGSDAEPTAIPFNDGVENLLKYAFNMNLGGPDVTTMVPGGSSGLPLGRLVSVDGQSYWRVEFVRRRSSGLIYSPEKSSTLEPGSFTSLTGAVSVDDLGGTWERVTIDEPCNTSADTRCFTRVAVTLP